MSTDNPQAAPGSGSPPATQASFASPADTTLSEALITLRKRRFLLIGCVILGILYGVYTAVTQIKLYEAYARIQVRTGSSNEFKLNALPSFEDDPQRKEQTEIAILTSDSLMTAVGREMNLPNNASFMGTKGPQPHRSMDDPLVRDMVVGTLQGGLKVALVPKTDIIRISYSSLDPKLSAEVVNHVVQDYIQRSYQTRFDSTQTISRWLSSQLDDLKQKVENSQEEVLDLQKKLGALGFDSKNSEVTTSLDDLAKASGTAKLARIVAESRYRQLSGMDPNQIESSIDSAPGAQAAGLSLLRNNLAQARADYAQKSATLGPNLDSMKAEKAEINQLQKEISDEENRLLTQAKENYLIAKANEDQTTAALESEKTDAYKLRDDQVAYTLKLREYESDRTLYEGLLQRLRTAGIEAGLESLEIDIVDPAVVPDSALTRPESSLVLTYGFIGLVVGILLALPAGGARYRPAFHRGD